MIELDFWARFVLATLGTWRFTHLLVHEDGPGAIFARLRRRMGDGFWGQVLDCFYCASFWVAAPFALFACRSPLERLVAWAALSGAACLLEQLKGEPLVIERLHQTTGEDSDAMLRTTKIGDEEGSSANGSFDPSAAGRQH